MVLPVMRDDQLEAIRNRKPLTPAQVAYTAPRAPAKPAPKPKSGGGGSSGRSRGGGRSSRSSGGGGSSSSGGGGGVKTSSDAPQVKALESLLASGFAKVRDQKLANARLIYAQQDAELVQGYKARLGSLLDNREDNEKAESDASFGNLHNRVREAGELLAQTASLGAGETDTLRAQTMAIRNWDANQSDINRSYFDTQRSVNSAITDLNADTRAARINLATETLQDYDQLHTNYYNQRADAWTQLGNIRANPYSDSYKANAGDYANVAKEASSAWKNPGVNASLRNWRGDTTAQEKYLNNSIFQGAATGPEIKRPEGSTLRKW